MTRKWSYGYHLWDISQLKLENSMSRFAKYCDDPQAYEASYKGYAKHQTY